MPVVRARRRTKPRVRIPRTTPHFAEANPAFYIREFDRLNHLKPATYFNYQHNLPTTKE